MCGHLMWQIEADLRDNHNLSHDEYEVLLRLAWAKDHRLRIHDLAVRSLFTRDALTRSGISRVVERLICEGRSTRERVREDGRCAYAPADGAWADPLQSGPSCTRPTGAAPLPHALQHARARDDGGIVALRRPPSAVIREREWEPDVE